MAHLLLALSSSLGSVPAAAAQQASSAARVTRSQIDSAIVEAERIVSSPGYSDRIRQIKRREIALLQDRLTEGDLKPGDQLILSVQGEKDLTDTFTVSAGRFVTLPGVADVSLRGVLRSEVGDYLAKELRRYLKDPIVHVRTTVRLSVLGSVAKPGFYQMPSEATIGDAVMLAGGPTGTVDPAKTRVQRGGVEILGREAFSAALAAGRTLDQANLQAGDVILVGGSRTPSRGNWPMNVGIPLVTGLVGFIFLIRQVF
ncbi:MAG TPA: polysaccharide biosynthesis/export family protein [Gemmatimonadales bacterium]|jgi:hypothetical protein|nr:polysaccharide biosynthesis/export family protein [Gemmatimonadales bacterium]